MYGVNFFGSCEILYGVGIFGSCEKSISDCMSTAQEIKQQLQTKEHDSTHDAQLSIFALLGSHKILAFPPSLSDTWNPIWLSVKRQESQNLYETSFQVYLEQSSPLLYRCTKKCPLFDVKWINFKNIKQVPCLWESGRQTRKETSGMQNNTSRNRLKFQKRRLDRTNSCMKSKKDPAVPQQLSHTNPHLVVSQWWGSLQANLDRSS